MQVVLGLLAIAVVLAVWYWRVHAARRASGRMGGGDVRVAARRLTDGSAGDTQTAEEVDDPRLAAAGIVVAVATMDGPISLAEIDRLKRAAQETFGVSEREALDIVSFGRWIAAQGISNGDSVRRLSRVVLKTAGPEAGPDLIRMVEEVATADGGPLADEQREAVAAVRRALGMEAAGRRAP